MCWSKKGGKRATIFFKEDGRTSRAKQDVVWDHKVCLSGTRWSQRQIARMTERAQQGSGYERIRFEQEMKQTDEAGQKMRFTQKSKWETREKGESCRNKLMT